MTRNITSILFVVSITFYIVINKGPRIPAEYTSEGEYTIFSPHETGNE